MNVALKGVESTESFREVENDHILDVYTLEFKGRFVKRGTPRPRESP